MIMSYSNPTKAGLEKSDEITLSKTPWYKYYVIAH